MNFQFGKHKKFWGGVEHGKSNVYILKNEI